MLDLLTGVCGQRMLWSVPTSTQPIGPRCPTCQALSHYVDHGRLTLGYLAGAFDVGAFDVGAFDELVDVGLPALAEVDPERLRLVSLTTAGHVRHAQHARAVATPRWAALRVPDPQFPLKTPAGRRSSTPVPPSAPGGQPVPTPGPGVSGAGPLRWARRPDEGRLRLLAPADVAVAAAGGHARALCGRWLPAEGLTLTGAAGALCLACVAGIPAISTGPHPGIGSAGSPAGPLLAGGGVGG
jgi:hypothetical protein